MKIKFLMSLLALGLLNNVQDSQAGLIELAWENRELVASGVAVTVATCIWLKNICTYTPPVSEYEDVLATWGCIPADSDDVVIPGRSGTLLITDDCESPKTI